MHICNQRSSKKYNGTGYGNGAQDVDTVPIIFWAYAKR
jgi:hypothetical protein